MFEFKHPKYYTELRKLRNKSDQAISPEAHDGERERAPGPGLKQQAASDSQVVNQVKLERSVPQSDQVHARAHRREHLR